MIKVAIIRSIGAGFLLLGKLFVAGGAASIGAFFLLTQPPYHDELFSIVPAVVAIALGAWIVGTGFMSVYNVAVDTIFLCYAVDLERIKNGQQASCPESISKLISDSAEEDGGVPPLSKRGSGRTVVREVSAGQLAEVASSTRQPAIEISDYAPRHGRV